VLRFSSKKSEDQKRLNCKGTRMQLSITQPDDWRLHLRDGDLLEGCLKSLGHGLLSFSYDCANCI
ncbi:hypothetical protein PIB30_111895, partial [Stylosanthes scabra]|nr:hypothetical protein [Stylosanthes scabra]